MPSSRSIHVAAAQVHSGGGVEATLARIRTQATAASTVGADVLLLSECVLQGYDYDIDRETTERISLPRESDPCQALQKMAAELNITVMAGFLERDDKSFYNSVLVAFPSGKTLVERKHCLSAIEANAGFSPGTPERIPIEINGVRCAILICADVAIKGLAEAISAQGIDYQFISTGGGGKLSDMIHARDLGDPPVAARYAESRANVFITEAILFDSRHTTGFAAANALGPVGRQTCHQGHCMIVDKHLVMRAQAAGTIVLEHQQDQMVHAVLDFDD
ncbi:MAG: carbon-nitrogen hydrolase family protein [Verrucomicrobia bacterium]|nr:carbon-nitrogen hydrolase family protein [Verrucomicrobiota bacterium]MDA1086313.1 carbon-nitrogen hydrolase family protein [Verrucomicrobiota bacterium]